MWAKKHNKEDGKERKKKLMKHSWDEKGGNKDVKGVKRKGKEINKMFLLCLHSQDAIKFQQS